MFISKIAVRQNIFFSILAERYPNVVFSSADTASLNRYFNLKGVKSLDNAATRALIESLPEDWEAAKTLINNELSSQGSGSEKETVAKALGVDVAELDSAELISWLKSRYIDNTVKEIHPVIESMPVVKKFLNMRGAILQKLSEDEGFKRELSSKGFNQESLKDSLKLTSDDMLWIMNQYEYGGATSIRTVGVEIREGEYLGKIGEWNIWFPHSQETSAKIAGYDDVTKEPHTTWCTGRTKGSNLYYHYVSRNSEDGYIHSFLFYIIKDNPVKKDNPREDNDWLSLGFVGTVKEEGGVGKNIIKPVLNGQGGGLTVNRANVGLKKADFNRILGADTADIIFQMCQNHIEEELNYKHPAVEELRAFAKDPDAVKKALYNKNAAEKKDFFNLMSEHNPTEDVLVEFSRFADVEFIKENFSKEWMQKPSARLRGEKPLDMAARSAAEKESFIFLRNFSEEPWARDYLGVAAEASAEKNPIDFLDYYSKEPWAQSYLKIPAKVYSEMFPYKFLRKYSWEAFAQDYLDMAAKVTAYGNPIEFVQDFSEEPWAQPYIGVAAKNAAEKDPYYFLRNFPDKPWAQDYLKIATENIIKKDPFHFLRNFSEKPWAQPYIDTAAKSAMEEDYYIFLEEFSEKPWAQDYIDTAAKSAMEEDYYIFLEDFSEKPWAQRYIDLAAKNMAEKKPYDFLYRFSYKSWAQPYLDAAAKNTAEVEPTNFLYNFLEEPWAQPYIGVAAKNAAEKDPYRFLIYSSKKPWAQPYLDTAARGAAEKDPYDFIFNFSEKSWAQPYLDTAAKNMTEKDSYKFLYNFSEEPWAQHCIDSVAKNYAEKNSYHFLFYFSDKPWANIPVDSIGGKTWVEYAREIAKTKEASSIDIKLKKLASFLLMSKHREELKIIKNLL
jgi:hypothetical protein